MKIPRRKRASARRSKPKAEVPAFPEWLRSHSPSQSWSWDRPHQLHLYKTLERVTSGEVSRLMIFMPPRHSKSETVTVRYTAWRLERDPEMTVILGSYNQKLANRFSRKVRREIEGRVEMSKERRAAEEWETRAGGGVRAAGVGGGVTGYGARLVMIDDPVKNRAQAESVAWRTRTWDWFNDDIYTRLEPGGAIVLIQTRWHDDDLAGRLLREMASGGEVWDKVDLPAIAEEADELGRPPGEALWPERFPVEALERIRRKLGSYSFAALYQQRPFPREGSLFKRHWFTRFIERPPEGLRWARGYDLAVSVSDSADYTASFRCGFDRNGDLVIADGFRARIEFPDQRRYVIERLREERNTAHGIERALHGQAFVQDLRRRRGVAHAPIRAVPVDGDKFTRALAWANRAEEGKVVLVRGAWNQEFIEEACRFTGKGDTHDDQIDAISLAVQMLAGRGGRGHSFD